MLNYQKIDSVIKPLNDYKSLPKVETKDIIKFNLGLAYFIALCFLLIKLLLT